MLLPALVFLIVVGLFPVAVKVGVSVAQRHELRIKKTAIERLKATR